MKIQKVKWSYLVARKKNERLAIRKKADFRKVSEQKGNVV